MEKVVFCVIWDFVEYFKFVKESRVRTKSHLAVRSLEAIDR